MGLGWYVLRTMPRLEYLAEKELRQDGFEVFSPRVNHPSQPTIGTEAPLFPGYLFLRCDPESNGWPSFRLAHRVIGWVRFGGVIPSLPDSAIDAIIEQLENSGQGLWKRFEKGEKVYVNSGGLECFAEVLEATRSPQSRSRVLVHFMNRLVQAQIPWEDLSPIHDHPNEIQRLPRRTRGRGRWINRNGPRPLAPIPA